MKEEKFVKKRNITKLTENTANLNISDLVVRLACSLRY